MIPPRHSIPLDYDAEPAASEVHCHWPEFVEERAVPAIGFWLAFIGGVAVGFIGACALAWSVLA